jgi:hypothetical protein
MFFWTGVLSRQVHAVGTFICMRGSYKIYKKIIIAPKFVKLILQTFLDVRIPFKNVFAPRMMFAILIRIKIYFCL